MIHALLADGAPAARRIQFVVKLQSVQFPAASQLIHVDPSVTVILSPSAVTVDLLASPPLLLK